MGGAKQVIQGMSSGEGEGIASEGNEAKGKEPRTREETEMRERLIERPGGEGKKQPESKPKQLPVVLCFYSFACFAAFIREGEGVSSVRNAPDSLASTSTACCLGELQDTKMGANCLHSANHRERQETVNKNIFNDNDSLCILWKFIPESPLAEIAYFVSYHSIQSCERANHLLQQNIWQGAVLPQAFLRDSFLLCLNGPL